MDNHQNYRPHKPYRSPATFVRVRILLCRRKRIFEYKYSRFERKLVCPPVRLVLM